MAETSRSESRVGKDLTEGPILQVLLALTGPLILTDLLQQLYSMVDLIVIGQFVGSAGTVAVSTGSEITDVLTPIANGLAMAGQIYIGQMIGQKNYKDCEKTVGTLLTVMAGFSLIFMVATIAGHNLLLTILNCPEEALAPASNYMIITAFGVPFVFIYNAICGILRGLGETKRPLTFVVVAASVNIVLDLILVAGFHLDAAGTAVATTAAQMGSAIAAGIYLYWKRSALGFTLKASSFRIDPHTLRILFRLGIPRIISSISVRISLLWCKSQINAYGLVAAATYSVGNKLQKLCIVFVQSVSSGAGTIVSQNLGARKLDRVEKTVTTTLRCTLVAAICLSAICLLFPRPLFRIFTNDPEVIESGVTFLRILCITFFMAAFYSSFLSVVNGSGFASLEFFTGMMDGVVCRIGFSLLFVHVFNMGVESYYLGSALARGIPGIICMCYFLSGKWRTRKLLSEKK